VPALVVLWFCGSGVWRMRASFRWVLWWGVGFPVGSGFHSFPLSYSPLFSSLYHFPGRAHGAGACRGLRAVACHLVVVA